MRVMNDRCVLSVNHAIHKGLPSGSSETPKTSETSAIPNKEIHVAAPSSKVSVTVEIRPVPQNPVFYPGCHARVGRSGNLKLLCSEANLLRLSREFRSCCLDENPRRCNYRACGGPGQALPQSARWTRDERQLSW